MTEGTEETTPEKVEEPTTGDTSEKLADPADVAPAQKNISVNAKLIKLEHAEDAVDTVADRLGLGHRVVEELKKELGKLMHWHPANPTPSAPPTPSTPTTPSE